MLQLLEAEMFRNVTVAKTAQRNSLLVGNPGQ